VGYYESFTVCRLQGSLNPCLQSYFYTQILNKLCNIHYQIRLRRGHWLVVRLGWREKLHIKYTSARSVYVIDGGSRLVYKSDFSKSEQNLPGVYFTNILLANFAPIDLSQLFLASNYQSKNCLYKYSWKQFCRWNGLATFTPNDVAMRICGLRKIVGEIDPNWGVVHKWRQIYLMILFNVIYGRPPIDNWSR
jgi:hypothetical protein